MSGRNWRLATSWITSASSWRVLPRTQAQSRAAGYGFLAWLFLEEPDCDFVARLLADDMQDSFR